MENGKRPIAANDNRALDDKRRGKAINLPNDGPPPGWLAERDAAGWWKESDGKHVGRIEKALVKSASPYVATLRQIAELMRPAETAATVDLEGNGEEGGDINTGFGAERKHNQTAFLPSIPKLMAAYADGMRTRVTSKGGKIVGRICTTYHRDRTGETVTIGGTVHGEAGRYQFHGLQFHRGELVAYGYKGRKCRPKYVATKVGLAYGKNSETERHVEQSRANDLAYLGRVGLAPLRGAPANDNAPRAMEPPPCTQSATRAAAALAGAANDNVPVTRLPDGVAVVYGRLGGISEGKGTSATTAPRHAALDEIDRAETFASMSIDGAEIELIEAVLSGESFRTIGLRFGYAESSAHRSGRQVVERTLERISEKIAA